MSLGNNKYGSNFIYLVKTISTTNARFTYLVKTISMINPRFAYLVKTINRGYQQRLKDLKLIGLAQRRLRGQLIEVFKYLNRFKSTMLFQEVSSTSLIGLEIMEKMNSEVIQYISSIAFLPNKYYNNLECSTL